MRHSPPALALALALACTVGCGPRNPEQRPREGALHRDQVFDHDGETRTYHFYEPADVSEPRPLTLVLHGGGGEADNNIGISGNGWPHQVWLDIADEDNLFVLAPQGLRNHWNDCRAECERCPDSDDVGFLLGLLDDLAGRHDIDTTRLYVTGESNGGFMTQRLIQEAPERFAAAGVVISLLPANSQCDVQDVPMPVMYQVGTEDAVILYEGGSADPQIVVQSADDTIAYWRALNGCDPEPVTTTLEDLDPDDRSTATRDDYDCAATGTGLSLITLVGAGHVAPSSAYQVSGLWESIAGIQNHDVESARELWAFFAPFARE